MTERVEIGYLCDEHHHFVLRGVDRNYERCKENNIAPIFIGVNAALGSDYFYAELGVAQNTLQQWVSMGRNSNKA